MKLNLRTKENDTKQQLGVQIWKSDYDYLQEIATANGITLAMLTRSIINDFIEKETTNNQII